MTPEKINKIGFILAERLCKKSDVLGARHPEDTPQDMRLGSSGVGKAVVCSRAVGKVAEGAGEEGNDAAAIRKILSLVRKLWDISEHRPLKTWPWFPSSVWLQEGVVYSAAILEQVFTKTE